MNPIFLGIGGGTGSGKTTFARGLLEALGSRATSLLPLDAYYRNLPEIPLTQNRLRNFDCPQSLDLPLLLAHVRDLKAGRAVGKPIYSFPEHARLERSEPVQPAPVILVEGILTLALEELLPFLDYKIYIDAPADLRFIRRLTRDVAERGRQLDSEVQQYLETVRPMHDRYVEPSRTHADLIVQNAQPNPKAMEVVLGFLRHRIGPS